MADADPKIEKVQPIAINTIGEIDAPPQKRRSWGRIALMVSVPLLIVAGASYVYLTSGRYVSTDNAYVQQDMISVSPFVSGPIQTINVRENQQVKAGDVMFTIDPAPFKVALDQANAALAAARVDISTKATDAGGAAADIESAKADIALDQANFERQAALMKQGFTTRSDYDSAVHALAAAKATLATAQASAAHARAQISSGDASGTPAGVQQALANREQAALNLARTVVRAPKDGIVSQTSRLQIGNVTVSGVPALSLVVSQQAWVEANFKETDLNHMAPNQCAELKFDAYPGLKVKGHVQSIGAGTGSEFSVLPAQNATGNWVKVSQRIPIRVAIDGHPSRAMIAGLSTDVKVDTKTMCR